MSINNSYFSKNNTILSNSYTNTGKNPVTEIYYGVNNSRSKLTQFSRFIFDLNLDLLKEKVQDRTISVDCNNIKKHILRMTNTSTFNVNDINTPTSQGRMKSTSFDLVLFRIPYFNNDPSTPQLWDEGVGYDFSNNFNQIPNDKNFSNRPSNWFQRTTLDNWEEPGLYNNKNQGTVNYSDLVIVDTQHFQFGDENVEFDMTTEINGILNNTIQNVSGWGIAYKPALENFTGLTDSYEVQFFTRHTQTFYEPFLESTYDDLIEDDRNLFTLGKTNKLYLYTYEDGNPFNLDNNPNVTIHDSSGAPIVGLTNLPTCLRTKGVYEVTIPPLVGYKSPCTFVDTWSNLKLNGLNLANITNEFVLYPLKNSIQIGTTTNEPKIYGFDYYGIKQNEKIFNTDVRKVGVIIKQAYTKNKMLPKVSGYYRVYVKEGQIEVQVQDWTKLNRTPNEYYFIFDTRDKIPNEYYIDIKVESTGEINTYKRQIKFDIVSYK